MLTDALIKNITTMVDDPLLTHVVIFLILIYVVIKLISGFDAQRNDSANFIDGFCIHSGLLGCLGISLTNTNVLQGCVPCQVIISGSPI